MKNNKNAQKTTEPASKIGVCHYHLCNKKTTVYKCKYCGDYFCKEHLEPKPPGMPQFKDDSPESIALMEKWREDGGHPCVPFYDAWKEEQRKRKERENRVINKLISTPRRQLIQSTPTKPQPKPSPPRSTSTYYYPQPQRQPQTTAKQNPAPPQPTPPITKPIHSWKAWLIKKIKGGIKMLKKILEGE